MESLSVIIPVYNEEQTIAGVLARVLSVMNEFPGDWEVVIVNDGSTDKTLELCTEFLGDRVRVLQHEQNRGAGDALRTGMADSRCELAIFVPADGQFDPREIPMFAEAAKNADVVLGVRKGRDHYSMWRKLQSRIYLNLMNLLFRQRYSDVNWVQLWRMPTAGKLEISSKGVFMQQELIDKAKLRGLSIVEIPSRFLKRGGGKAKGSSFRTVLVTIRELIVYKFARG